MGDFRTSIIFCQSAIKASAVLHCYEKEKKDGRKVVIVVRNVESIYHFFRSLNLDASIIWFKKHSCDIISLLRRIKFKRTIDDDMSKLMVNETEIAHVYFTSICNDLLMGCYLKRFPAEKVVKIQGAPDINGHIDDYSIPVEDYPLNIRVKKYVYSFLLGYKIRIQMVGCPVLALDIGHYKYPCINYSSLEVCRKYSFKPQRLTTKNAIVFASGYQDIFGNREEYVRVFMKCVKELTQKKYTVYLKGHPRIGLVKEVQELTDYTIPEYIPAEFVDYTSFDCAFGLMTAAICSTSNYIKSYSLLPVSYLVNDKRYSGWCDYLDKTSGGKVLYLKSFDDIK